MILTAPGKGDLKNIVAGINSHLIEPSIRSYRRRPAPPMPSPRPQGDGRRAYGIVVGHVETVHAYTNDQNLTDNYHKASRRGRSAPLNMVITGNRGRQRRRQKVLPQLMGKLSGNAIRVPTPNVSMAILNLTLAKAKPPEEVNEFMRNQALHSALRNQIDYSASPKWSPRILSVRATPVF